MKTIKLIVITTLLMMSCSSDDANEKKCQEVRDKSNKLIELAADDHEQRKTLIRNRDRELEILGCL
ncbi:hypothetical protein [Gelidibacter maritimus]|uniref:Lipoprotein n=1 Tax=Gelidibacter maritimus TaxID=2761487 RepID=A0A7W2M770_9FLAO|nr:hypothetical protein [Gelidibacter maritimus]MBA6153949.1 hypothetical protein [Gelidibacter maritimus]